MSSLPTTKTVAENEGMVQICATLVNHPAFAVLANSIAVNFTTYDGTGNVLDIALSGQGASICPDKVLNHTREITQICNFKGGNCFHKLPVKLWIMRKEACRLRTEYYHAWCLQVGLLLGVAVHQCALSIVLLYASTSSNNQKLL